MYSTFPFDSVLIVRCYNAQSLKANSARVLLMTSANRQRVLFWAVATCFGFSPVVGDPQMKRWFGRRRSTLEMTCSIVLWFYCCIFVYFHHLGRECLMAPLFEKSSAGFPSVISTSSTDKFFGEIWGWLSHSQQQPAGYA